MVRHLAMWREQIPTRECGAGDGERFGLEAAVAVSKLLQRSLMNAQPWRQQRCSWEPEGWLVWVLLLGVTLLWLLLSATSGVSGG